MHPQIEKLEQLFERGKNDPAALSKFYYEIWIGGAMLPHADIRGLVNRVLDWTKQLVPLEPANLAMATFASAFMSFHEGNFGVSLLTAAEAGKLFAAINDLEGMAAATSLEGFNYRSLGEMDLALKHVLDAYQELSKTNRFKIFYVFCLYHLAEIYSETGQYDEALRYHRITEKFTIEGDTANKVMLSRTYNGIGIVYQHQKKYALALDYLNRSLKLAEEIESLPVKARALTDLGSYYFEMGDYVLAADYQHKALSIRNDLNIQSGAITNMILLADIETKSGRQDEAIEWLNKALPIAEELKVKQKMYQIHLMLSNVFQAKGELLKSLFHYKSYHSIREEVQHDDNEKKIKNLQLIFEAEQTKKENVIIKKQKQEIEEKNIELQDTIDELTLTKISRKAKALTLLIAVVLFVFEDSILAFALGFLSTDNYYISLAVKMGIVFSLNPIDKAIEHFLLRKVIKKKSRLRNSLV